MGDLDFEELDKAINELYESLDDDFAESTGDDGTSSRRDDDVSHSASSPEVVPASQPLRTRRSGRGVPGLSRRHPMSVNKSPSMSATESVNDHGAEHSDELNNTKAAGSTQHGHFMDMVHPSSDAQVQHKHNFAAERQAELDARMAEMAEAVEAEQSESESVATSKIPITVEDDAGIKQPEPSLSKAKTITVSDATTQDQSEHKAETKPDTSKPDDQSSELDAAEPVKPAHTAGRRAVQYSNANRRTRRDLAQPTPAVVNEVAEEAAKTAVIEPYEAPFLPDAKVAKRPLGGVAKSTNATDQLSDETGSDDKPGDQHKSTEPIAVSRRREHGNTNDGLADDMPVATRPSVRSAQSRRSTGRRSGSATRQTTDTEMSVRDNKMRAMQIIGRIILFVAIVIIGVLTGMAFYYYGG